MLKLAERMVLSFCTGVGASTAHTWTTISGSGDNDVRVMTRKSVDDPGRPPGIVLSAATSFWIPVPPKRVFDFLRDENSRSEVGIIFQIICRIFVSSDIYYAWPSQLMSMTCIEIAVWNTINFALGQIKYCLRTTSHIGQIPQKYFKQRYLR